MHLEDMIDEGSKHEPILVYIFCNQTHYYICRFPQSDSVTLKLFITFELENKTDIYNISCKIETLVTYAFLTTHLQIYLLINNVER